MKTGTSSLMDGKDYKQRNFVFSDDHITDTNKMISDKVLFEQATVAMEEHYGYDCETEIDAYFRGAKWMQKQFKTK